MLTKDNNSDNTETCQACFTSADLKLIHVGLLARRAGREMMHVFSA